MTETPPPSAPAVPPFDVVVVGAGMAGLYAVHHFRELGFSVVALEQGAGVGGTWFWNRYPGCRCDVPSLEYSYGFSEELEQEWEWTEVFPSQPEIERYLNHVADRFDLRRDIRLETRVVGAAYDETARVWAVETEGGDTITGRFLVMASGNLSVPQTPELPGLETFAGPVLYTSMWPRDGVDLSGQRVALIGTGSSGVQSTPELADMAAHLTVFQRTPTYTWPSYNGPLDPEVQRRTKEHYRELRVGQRANPGGVTGSTGAIILQTAEDRRILEVSEEERLAVLEELQWNASRVWFDALTNPEANELAWYLHDPTSGTLTLLTTRDRSDRTVHPLSTDWDGLRLTMQVQSRLTVTSVLEGIASGGFRVEDDDACSVRRFSFSGTLTDDVGGLQVELGGRLAHGQRHPDCP